MLCYVTLGGDAWELEGVALCQPVSQCYLLILLLSLIDKATPAHYIRYVCMYVYTVCIHVFCMLDTYVSYVTHLVIW